MTGVSAGWGLAGSGHGWSLHREAEVCRGGCRSNCFGFVSVAQASLAFVILLPQPLESWDYRSVHTYLASACFPAGCSSAFFPSQVWVAPHPGSSGVCGMSPPRCGHTSSFLIILWLPKFKVLCVETGSLYTALAGLWLTVYTRLVLNCYRDLLPLPSSRIKYV